MTRALVLALAALGAAVPWVTPCRVTPHRVQRSLGWDGRSRGGGVLPDPAQVDLAVLLDLMGIALAAGAPVPRALGAVGCAIGGSDGAALRAAGAALTLGAPWDEAWRVCPRRLEPLGASLGRVWCSGASPGGVLRASANAVRRTREREVGEAAARLGARLVVPLGLCHLPAFILLGLVPVVISLGRGLA